MNSTDKWKTAQDAVRKFYYFPMDTKDFHYSFALGLARATHTQLSSGILKASIDGSRDLEETLLTRLNFMFSDITAW